MSRKTKSRDVGMTLPEVLISVVLTGLLVATLGMSLSVVLHQTDNTEGRLNNAVSEQSVSLWMPADLASADIVDTDPGAKPCTMPCPPEANVGGSNALMLTWTSQIFDVTTGNPVTTVTKVSYRYMQIGTEWVLVRVECVVVGAGGAVCNSAIVLHDLDAPPDLETFVPGVTRPIWVIQVSQATDPASTGAPGETIPVDPALKNKNGQRVIVTINGGGDVAGMGGGTNQIALSAGGTERKIGLNTQDPSGVPPFIAARSRCGGNFALIVDVSGSIGQVNMGANISGTPRWDTVRGSIYKFIEAFQGTPVMLQAVKFSVSASTLGASGDDQKYYDMLDPAQVAALKALVGYPNTAGGLQSGGNTNWEDGFYEVFKKADGTVQPILPKTVIFFTDGIPTKSRLESVVPAPPADPSDITPAGQPDGGTYYQTGFNRTNRVMREFDADVETLIGMFVGSDTAQSAWYDTRGYRYTNWQKGYHEDYQRGNNVVWEKGYHDDYQRGNNVVWERGYHDGAPYQRGNNVVWEKGYHDDYQRGNNVVWEKGYHNDYQRGNNVVWERNNNVVFERSGSGMTYEQNVSGTWVTRTATQFFQPTGNTSPTEADGWRARVTGSTGSWTSASPGAGASAMNQATYDITNQNNTSSDGFRMRLPGSLSGSWTGVTQAQYDASNSVAANTDGWRTRQTAASTSWTSVTSAAYNLSNLTGDATDGWQTVRAYSSPYSLWEASTQAAYDPANTVAAETDGWRTRQTSSSTSWTTVTSAAFTASNLTSDSTDGWQITKAYSTPFTTWEASNQGLYLVGNMGPAETDGWRTRETSPSSSWTNVTSTQYNASNVTLDATDGWKAVKLYSSPYSLWEPTTQALYDPANTVAAETDGWRTRQTAASTSWTSVSSAMYTASNLTGDATDGWQIARAYSSPYSLWEATTQAVYDPANTMAAETDGWRTRQTAASTSWTPVTAAVFNASNLTADSTDGWQVVRLYSSPYSLWEAATEASYNASNPSTTVAADAADAADGSDGWTAEKLYAAPYTAYEAMPSVMMYDKDILGKLIQPVGSPVTPLTDGSGNVTNAATANLYSVSNYALLNSGMQAIALAECGGTLTIQTRLTSGASAQDPFTYQNSIDQKTVKTTGQFRGGTFDFETTGSVSPTITTQNLTDLTHYSPVSWACSAKGQPRSFTTAVTSDSPWPSITVTVAANEAVSCTQTVQWTP